MPRWSWVSGVLLLVMALACAPAAPAPPAAPAGGGQPASAGAAPAAPAAASAPSATTAPPAPVRIRVAHSAIAGSQALLNVAQEAGLFMRHGLEVELTNVGGRAATQALVSGELAAILSSGVEVVASGLAGADGVIVASGLNTLDMSIWSREVTQPAELRGKRVGVSQIGESTDFAMRYALRQWGLEPGSDVEVLQTGQPPQRLAALESGAVEANIIQPPLTVRARKAGLHKLGEVSDMGLEYQHTCLITTRRRLAEDPEPIGRLVGAWAEAMYYYRAQPEASRAAVGRFMQLEDPEALAETYAHYDRLYVRPPYPTLKGIQAILDVLADEDPRARDHRPEEFVDTRFLDRLQQAGQFQAWEQQYPPAS